MNKGRSLFLLNRVLILIAVAAILLGHWRIVLRNAILL